MMMLIPLHILLIAVYNLDTLYKVPLNGCMQNGPSFWGICPSLHLSTLFTVYTLINISQADHNSRRKEPEIAPLLLVAWDSRSDI